MPAKCKYHRYRRLYRGKKKTLYYKCTDCSSFSLPEDIIGNDCRCFYDDQLFKMTKNLLFIDSMISKPRLKPHCGCRFEKPALKPVTAKPAQNSGPTTIVSTDKFGALDDLLKDIAHDK
jgi:hypothetical protein